MKKTVMTRFHSSVAITSWIAFSSTIDQFPSAKSNTASRSLSQSAVLLRASRLASSFHLLLSSAADLRTISRRQGLPREENRRSRRPRDSHRARVHSHSFRARYRNLASAKILQTPTEAARGGETNAEDESKKEREKWPVQGNILLVDVRTSSLHSSLFYKFLLLFP